MYITVSSGSKIRKWRRAVPSTKENLKPHFAEIFQFFAKDNDDYLDVTRLRFLAFVLGRDLSAEEALVYLKQFGGNSMDFNQFYTWWTSKNEVHTETNNLVNAQSELITNYLEKMITYCLENLNSRRRKQTIRFGEDNNISIILNATTTSFQTANSLVNFKYCSLPINEAPVNRLTVLVQLKNYSSLENGEESVNLLKTHLQTLLNGLGSSFGFVLRKIELTRSETANKSRETRDDSPRSDKPPFLRFEIELVNSLTPLVFRVIEALNLKRLEGQMLLSQSFSSFNTLDPMQFRFVFNCNISHDAVTVLQMGTQHFASELHTLLSNREEIILRTNNSFGASFGLEQLYESLICWSKIFNLLLEKSGSQQAKLNHGTELLKSLYFFPPDGRFNATIIDSTSLTKSAPSLQKNLSTSAMPTATTATGTTTAVPTTTSTTSILSSSDYTNCTTGTSSLSKSVEVASLKNSQFSGSTGQLLDAELLNTLPFHPFVFFLSLFHYQLALLLDALFSGKDINLFLQSLGLTELLAQFRTISNSIKKSIDSVHSLVVQLGLYEFSMDFSEFNFNSGSADTKDKEAQLRTQAPSARSPRTAKNFRYSTNPNSNTPSPRIAMTRSATFTLPVKEPLVPLEPRWHTPQKSPKSPTGNNSTEPTTALTNDNNTNHSHHSSNNNHNNHTNHNHQHNTHTNPNHNHNTPNTQSYIHNQGNTQSNNQNNINDSALKSLNFSKNLKLNRAISVSHTQVPTGSQTERSVSIRQESSRSITTFGDTGSFGPPKNQQYMTLNLRQMQKSKQLKTYESCTGLSSPRGSSEEKDADEPDEKLLQESSLWTNEYEILPTESVPFLTHPNSMGAKGGEQNVEWEVGVCKRTHQKVLVKRFLNPTIYQRRSASLFPPLQHPNLLKVLTVYYYQSHLTLVYEYPGGTAIPLYLLLIKQGGFPEWEAKIHVGQLLDLLEYLHSKNITHRDLRPEYFVLVGNYGEQKLKLTSFGFATKAKNMTAVCGSPPYMAPEVLLRTEYTKECDLWSLGALTYVFLCGYPPFSGVTPKEVFVKVLNQQYSFDDTYWANVSSAAKQFVHNLLIKTPAQRSTIAQCRSHYWFE